MERIVLKKDIIEIIQNDAILFGKIAHVLRLKPITIPKMLRLNHAKLTQAAVLITIRQHLNLSQDSDVLEMEGGDDSDKIGQTKIIRKRKLAKQVA